MSVFYSAIVLNSHHRLDLHRNVKSWHIFCCVTNQNSCNITVLFLFELKVNHDYFMPLCMSEQGKVASRTAHVIVIFENVIVFRFRNGPDFTDVKYCDTSCMIFLNGTGSGNAKLSIYVSFSLAFYGCILIIHRPLRTARR